jgi:hypothetical protein
MIRPKHVVAAAAVLMSLTGPLAAQSTGVAACDDFMTKYEACLTGKVPAAARTQYKTQIDEMRKTWSDLAKNPAVKSTLEGTCKQTADQMKMAMSSFGCSF